MGRARAGRPWYYLSFEERAALVGALGGITFGYDIGVISGALVSLQEDFNLDADAEGLVVGMLAFGQMPGSIIGGIAADCFGRKPAIYLQNACYILGTFCSAGATNLSTLLFGQFVVGVGVACSVASNVSYVTEMVAPERAGAMVSLYELATTFGVFLAYVVFLVLSNDDGGDESYWRTMYYCGLAFPVLQWVAVCAMPESPRWLFSVGRVGAAAKALLTVHGEDATAAGDPGVWARAVVASACAPLCGG